jgi:hypothetical protein
MSNLLEQAIIDAAALKEVAMKNAEAALIEKYSREFKESVERLLEQEQPTVDTVASADPLTTSAATDSSGMQSGTMQNGPEEAFSDVGSSFLEGEQHELVTIDFNELKKQISSALSPQSPMLSSPEIDLATSEEDSEVATEINENFEESHDAGGQDKSSPKDDGLHE